MTELFNALAEIEAPLSEEDRVIYLLASLPESFGVLVTALETSPEVPKMEVVTERLLHPDLPGKVPLIRPCPASRPTERSFNGLSRWLPSRAENSCTLTLAS